MTLQIELRPLTESTLRAAAEQHNVPVEEYLRQIVESALHPSVIPARNPAKTPEELDRWFKRMSEFSAKIPEHPGQTWSRETMYDDHD